MATPNSIALELIEEREEATDDAGYVQRVERRVNNALDEIAVATEWNHFRARDQQPTVIGQAQYNLPAGGREIIQLRYVDTGQPIRLWTIQDAAARSYRVDQPGRACFWLEDGVLLSGSDNLYRYRLGPVPDSILQIEREWFYHPSEVASGVQMPVQDQLIVLVKDHVRAQMLTDIDQKYDAADRYRTNYRTNLARLIGRENRKVAAETRLQPSDLKHGRRPQAMFDPAHFENDWI